MQSTREAEAHERRYEFRFDKDTAGWVGGFADLPDGVDWGTVCGHRPLPAQSESIGGFFISGNNHSDDLFMFLKRRVDGLGPGQEYDIGFAIEFLTDSPSGCAGTGGAPGESVVVKAGATMNEPVAVLVDGYWRMNIDVGHQSTGGKDAVVIGNVANGSPDCIKRIWKAKNVSTNTPILARAASDGSLWLILATDSGFESTTSLYYTHVVVTAVAR